MAPFASDKLTSFVVLLLMCVRLDAFGGLSRHGRICVQLHTPKTSLSARASDEKSSLISRNLPPVERTASASRCMSSSPLNENNPNDDIPDNPMVVDHPRLLLLQRACITTVSCLSTWALIQFGGLSIVRGCGIHAMAASLVLQSPAYATASLAGSFAGMTGLVSLPLGVAASSTGTLSAMALWREALWPVIQLGMGTGLALYWWDSGTPKIHAGKGGRLGTMAVLGHVAYLALHNRPLLRHMVRTIGGGSIVLRGRPYAAPTLVAMILACLVLYWSRQEPIRSTEVFVEETGETTTIYGRRVEDTNLSSQTLGLRTIASYASKAAILCFLLSFLPWPMAQWANDFVPCLLSTFVGAFMVGRSQHAPVFAVGFTCWAASCLFASHANASILMLSMAMGSFAGLTRLDDRYTTNFQLLQTSVLSTLLLCQFRLLPQMGGRLGLFAFLGVLFGM